MVLAENKLINPSTLRTRKFRKNHPNYMKNWKKTHRRNLRISEKRQRNKLRRLVIYNYSNGTNTCKCCGVNTFEFLTIDHINNDGAEHKRREEIKNGIELYKWLKRNGYPKGFQVLCWNCNTAKHFHGVCPHQRLGV